MNPGIIILGAVVAVALVAAAAKPKQADIEGMEDEPVSIDNIRKGVSRGWYTAVLTRIDGKPAIRLTGKNTNGGTYTDVFPITQADFDQLHEEGYLIEL